MHQRLTDRSVTTMTLPNAQHDPKWRRLPEERPQQILKAALEVFSESGIAAAKLDDIAERAGVSKGTIYLYFDGKEALFRAVVREWIVPRIAEGERVIGDGSAADQLVRYLRHHWSCFAIEGSDGWVRLILLELHKFPELEAFYKQEVIAASNLGLGGIISRGIERGEFRDVDPTATVRMIKSITLMHIIWMRNHQTDPAFAGGREATIDRIIDFVLHALRATD